MRVPTSKFQKRVREHEKEMARPGTGMVHSTPAIILETYDAETLASITPSNELKAITDSTPGLIFSKVKILNTGQELILPFAELEDYIYLVYGNSMAITGRACRVEYNSMNIYNGRVVISRSAEDPAINLSEACTTFDIGGII